MPAVHRLGDIGTGHQCWPSRPNIKASTDVRANALGWHREGDPWEIHCCVVFPFPCHIGSLQAGSSTVYVNNRQAGRVSDPVDCGSYAATGSGNVFCGG